MLSNKIESSLSRRRKELKILVRVKPNAKEEKIDKIKEGEFLIRVNVPAKEGKANARVVELLSEYFSVAKGRIVILKGHNSRNKIIEIR